MKKHWMALLIFLLSLGAFIAWMGPKVLSIVTGYTSKYVCSSHFISQSDESRLTIDLDFFPINKATYEIDEASRSVTSKLWGLGAKTAYFYDNGISTSCSFSPPAERWKGTQAQRMSLPDTLPWPYGDGDVVADREDVDYDKLNGVLEAARDSYPSNLAICVAYEGELIGEIYGAGVSHDKPLLGWSMTKTMANAIVGRLVAEGKVSIDTQGIWPSWVEDDRRDISLWNLLQMNSGLKFKENYFMVSHVTRMLYLQDDKAAYAARSKLSHPPGTHWYYSSGTTNIISGYLQNVCASQEEYLKLPYKVLFEPLGMTSACIETDASGTYVMSSYGWATARDWTRFGQFYLQDGIWNGQRLLPEGWVDRSTTPAMSSKGAYGAQIWLNTNRMAIPSVPEDAYFENGFGGQRVLVIPSKNMVISVLSGMQMDFDFDQLYSDIFSCISE